MWTWIRVPKVIALLAFLLPWMTISCSGQQLVSGSGLGLATGNVEAANMLRNAGGAGTMANGWILLALVVIAIGTMVSFVMKRNGAKFVLATSILGLLLAWGGMTRYTKEAIRQAAASRNPGGLDQAALALIQVDWLFGFWLMMIALVTSAMIAWAVLTDRDGDMIDNLRGLRNPNDGVPQLLGKACPKCGKTYPADRRYCGEDGTELLDG